jgi:hypothetical protein
MAADRPASVLNPAELTGLPEGTVFPQPSALPGTVPLRQAQLLTSKAMKPSHSRTILAIWPCLASIGCISRISGLAGNPNARMGQNRRSNSPFPVWRTVVSAGKELCDQVPDDRAHNSPSAKQSSPEWMICARLPAVVLLAVPRSYSALGTGTPRMPTTTWSRYATNISTNNVADDLRSLIN